MDERLLELLGLALAALYQVSGDVEALQEMPLPLPDVLVETLREHAGMKAALALATELLPADAARQVKATYRAAKAHSRGGPDLFPPPLMPETMAEVDAAIEILRRARLVDSDLDRAVREHLPNWAAP